MNLESNVVLVGIAILPVLVLLTYIYFKDKQEKEPLSLLLLLLALGAFSVIPALVLELIGEDLLIETENISEISYLLIDNFLIVALSEELSKYFFLRIASWRHKAFNYAFDGIVYAVFIGLGFALAENIMYVRNYGFDTGIVRALTAVPAHYSFGIWMGFFYSLAKEASNQGSVLSSKLFKLFALLIPILIHGTYDFIATITDSDLAVLVFIIFIIIIDFITITITRKRAKQDHAIISEA